MAEFSVGSEWTFHPERGKPRKGTIWPEPSGNLLRHGEVAILLEGDPFPVIVQKGNLSACKSGKDQVTSTPKVRKQERRKEGDKRKMAKTKTKGKAKALMAEAKSLGIKGAADMGLSELAAAVKAAKAGSERPRKRVGAGEKVSKEEAAKTRPPSKRSAAKATAKAKPSKAKPEKSAPAVSTSASGENPFRKGSDLHVIAPLLLKGGKRKVLAERLSKKIQLHPYSAKKESEVDLQDFDKRLLLAAGTLRRKFGYTEVREGRGLEGTIRVLPPGEAAAKSNGKGKSKNKR